MKELFVKKIDANKNVSLKEAERILERQTVTNLIDTINWQKYNYKPAVAFRIGHINDEIWLKYYVKEKHIRALETRTNGDVYKDSCVEFFISFDNKNYYNCEFSCIGTVHLAFGPGRNNRKFISPSQISAIKIESSLGNEPFEEKTGNFEWELMVRIPIEVFTLSDLKTLNDKQATANFYKCGDATSAPHYVTWNPIETNEPDYHQPKYFGKIRFE